MLILNILINNTNYQYNSPWPLTQSKWNHLLIAINYQQLTTICYYINTYSTLGSQIIPPFIDFINSTMFIGSSSSFSYFFQGFIYSFEIYTCLPNIELLSSRIGCNNCDTCFNSGYCLPLCNISEYYSSENSQCKNCLKECINGCINNSTCNLCNDQNCYYCNNFNPYSCIECNINYQSENSSCIVCNSTSYYDINEKVCNKCKGLCVTCESDIFCMTCTQNSHLNINNGCECDQGYSGIDSCIRNTFAALSTLSANNNVNLIFTEPLKKDLTETNINLQLNTILQVFTISKIDNSTYTITINFTSNINQGDLLVIEFPVPLISNINSLLLTDKLSIHLFATDINNLVSQINQLKTYSQIGLAIGLSAAFGSSAVILDFTPFFNFLNAAEIYSYVVLYQLDLDPILINFLSELRVNSKIPSIYNYFIDPLQGVQIGGNLNGFGYTTNLLLLNSGVNMTILVAALAAVVPLYYLHKFKNKWIKEKSGKLLSYLQYGFFLRLWIQSCLELLLSSFVGIYYTNFANTTQIVDFSVCCCVLVIFIQAVELCCFVFLIVVIIKRGKISNSDEIEIFLKSYGTFFEEFKKEKLSNWTFYSIFFIRRLCLILVIIFITNPILQLSLTLSFSLLVYSI